MRWNAFLRLLARLVHPAPSGRPARRIKRERPGLERLEDRWNPAQLPPVGSAVYLQTNGPTSPLGRGDWYSRDQAGAGQGYHYFEINVPPGWNQANLIRVDLFSPEMNSNNPGGDEADNDGVRSNTLFEFYRPGTTYTPFASPGPGGAFSLGSQTFTPSSAPEQWVRFFTIDTAVTGTGTYLLRAESSLDDQNAWLLRVGLDNDSDPNNAPPANLSNPDGLAGTNDELTIGILQATYQHNGPGDQTLTLFEYVAPGQATATFNNFDLDGNRTVTYISPSGTTFAGTISTDSVWNNGGSSSTRSGDTINNPEPGWWRIVTTNASSNQYIQEGQNQVAAYYEQPPTPVIGLAKNDTLTTTGPTALLTYTITFTNTSSGATAGAANNLRITDTLPANVTFESAAFGPGFSGTITDPGTGNTGLVVFDLNQALNAGASGTVTVTVRVAPNAQTEVVNTAQAAFEDGHGRPFVSAVVTDRDTIPAVGGVVYQDLNNDGDRDGGEPGVGGVTVELYNQDTNTFVVSVTTNPDGTYIFRGLTPGVRYQLREQQPAGLLDGQDRVGPTGGTAGNDVLGDIILGAQDTNALGYDFGELPFVGIIGYAWEDLNGNGRQDGGEPALDGVSVTLTGTDDLGPIAPQTTTTVGGGLATFGNLRPGSYTLTYTAPNGLRFTVQDSPVATDANDSDTDPFTGATASFALAAGQSETSHAAGFFQAVSLGDLVWLNFDGDGAQDAGEPGLGGVSVELTQFGPDGVLGGPDDVTVATVTNAAGAFSFGNLRPGIVRIRVQTNTLPGGAVANFDADGGSDASAQLTLTSGTARDDADFGFVGTASLGDLLWQDLNGTGSTPDAGEPGLPGVTVRLRGPGLDGNFDTPDDWLFNPVVTDASGGYRFTQLLAGQYRIEVDGATLPANATPTFDPDGTADNRTLIGLAAGQINNAADFGYRGNGTIGDLVWNDRNGTGATPDAGEPGVPNVTVRLTAAGLDGLLGTGDDLAYAAQVTGSSGVYQFSNLLQGSYRVAVDPATLPSGLTQTFDPDGTADHRTDLTLNAGLPASVTTDFGYQGSGSIGDLVWYNHVAGGTQDAGEPGLANVQVQLSYAGRDGTFGTLDDIVYAPATTNASGSFGFAGVPLGTYRAIVATGTLPAGFAPNFDRDATADGDTTFTLTGGTPSLADVDFGFTGTGSLGDFVWLDRNGDGVQDAGEPGLDNVGVILTWAGQDGALGTADDVRFTTSTSPAGAFTFGQLPAGLYQASANLATLPAGVTPTFDADGGNDAQASITLVAGAARGDVDFGFTGTGSIAGMVFLDTNRDGLPDAGERGLDGVVISLRDQNGVIVASVTTGIDGSYSFPRLPAGSYTIEETQPAGFGSSTPDVRTLSLAPGEAASAPPFGDTAASISGFVYIDQNQNGVRDGSDPGVAGVTILLEGTDLRGTPVSQTVLTDAIGFYLFDGLLAGEYTLTQFQPGGLMDGSVNVGSQGGVANTNRVTSITLDAGEAGLSNNFGEIVPPPAPPADPPPAQSVQASKRRLLASQARPGRRGPRRGRKPRR